MNEKVLCLDFRGVKVIDFSCADEVIAKLVARVRSGELGDKYVVLTNLSESHRENIDAALKISKRNVLAKGGEKGWQVLGDLKEHVLDVLEILMKEKEITTRELVEDLDMKINTLSNKMAILAEDRLIYKERKPEPEVGGGRQFLYRSLF
jgi:DNA-binding transcriptional ArsR family regulator